jgi:hypothetical protein
VGARVAEFGRGHRRQRVLRTSADTWRGPCPRGIFDARGRASVAHDGTTPVTPPEGYLRRAGAGERRPPQFVPAPWGTRRDH